MLDETVKIYFEKLTEIEDRLKVWEDAFVGDDGLRVLSDAGNALVLWFWTTENYHLKSMRERYAPSDLIARSPSKQVVDRTKEAAERFQDLRRSAHFLMQHLFTMRALITADPGRLPKYEQVAVYDAESRALGKDRSFSDATQPYREAVTALQRSLTYALAHFSKAARSWREAERLLAGRVANVKKPAQVDPVKETRAPGGA